MFVFPGLLSHVHENENNIAAALSCSNARSYCMKFSPSNPTWYQRDRFILSNGHCCALQYAMLYLLSYKISLDDLKSFRQLNSVCPGHPENFQTPGVEVCTGPLGQGISNAVGMAISESHMRGVYGEEIVNNYTFVICGDGCLQEGISSEASSLAGHLKLGSLIVLYDDNNITIDGSTDLSFTEDVGARYEAYNWHVQRVQDDCAAIREAIEKAKAVKDRPSMVMVKTVIGTGSSKEGTAKTHGAPLGEEDLKSLKAKYGYDQDECFVVKDVVKSHYDAVSERSEKVHDDFKRVVDEYKAGNPEKYGEIMRRIEGDTEKADEILRKEGGGKDMATRKCSAGCLNSIAEAVSPFSPLFFFFFFVFNFIFYFSVSFPFSSHQTHTHTHTP